MFLLDDLDGRLPLPAGGEFPRLPLPDGDRLLLLGGVVRQHLLIGHSARRRHLQLLEVVELILDGVLEEYLRVALLDPGEEPAKEPPDRPRKPSHI